MSDDLGKTRHAAAIRILLGEVQPLVDQVTAAAKELEQARAKFQTDVAALSTAISGAVKDGANSALGVSRMTFESALDKREGALHAAGHELVDTLKHEVDKRGRALLGLDQLLQRRWALLLMFLAVFAIVGGAVGGTIAVHMLVGS